MTEPTPLLSDEKPVENLSRDQGSKHPCVGRRTDQSHQSHERFQQMRAKDNGLTETELKEVITHLAFYAGWPKAMSAITVAKRVFDEQ
ncbi:hypothetical protein KSF_005370 [Reticulibacter mediterranei]|uniref:Carboxymuconolactone decarboxylase-like domain-containing protein n=1 Tax=Reticulibacter mediterranei TaxID=2778369 RepID=A0A8J3MX24_9CHLR|nr:hypothetical protein KSF_005370 [Reticulibacter mediterranei]